MSLKEIISGKALYYNLAHSVYGEVSQGVKPKRSPIQAFSALTNTV